MPIVQKPLQEPYWNETSHPALRGDFTHNQAHSHTMYQPVHAFEHLSENRPPSAFIANTNSDLRRAVTSDWHQPYSDFSEWQHLHPSLDARAIPSVPRDFEGSRSDANDRGRNGSSAYISGSLHSRQQQIPSSNEVRWMLDTCVVIITWLYALFIADQLLVFASSFVDASLCTFRCAYCQIFRSAGFHFLATEAQGRRWKGARENRGCYLHSRNWNDVSSVRHYFFYPLMSLTWPSSNRFGNWAVQRCLEAASSSDERRKIASCMR